MNERGFATLPAMIVLLMLSYVVQSMGFTAGMFVETTMNFETENRLQLAAESALDNEIVKLCKGEAVDAENSLSNFPKRVPSTLEGIDEILLNVKTVDGNRVMVLAIARRDKYIGNTFNAFRAAGAFLEKDPENKRYTFKGYLHKKI